MSFTVAAMMCVYNEADILQYTIRHLLEQGIQVYVIDNWSTDGSYEIAREFPLLGMERFPEAPSKYYSWIPLLKRVEELAYTCGADWVLHHDADEIRRSDGAGESLLDGFARVDEQGYSAVNFRAYHFWATDDSYKGDPEAHFRYYKGGHLDGRMRHTKAWKRTEYRVDLVSSGGHIAKFPNARIYPESFVLKHYPLRSTEQARRKIALERVGRYDPDERRLGWHTHYDRLFESKQWLADRNELTLWSEDSRLAAPST
jgi:glycosyltransferase involved in cell wall biosynthesis